MGYWVLLFKLGEGAFLDALPLDGPESWRFNEGASLASEFPAHGVMKFSPNFPDRIGLFDFVSNMFGLLIVSKNVRKILESLGERKCEFLPITIHDHKGHVASRDHFILNLIGSQDVIDMDKSKYRMNPLEKGQIARVKHLVLKPEEIASDAVIFRATTKMDQYFINDAAHEAFSQEKLTGYTAVSADGWNGYALY